MAIVKIFKCSRAREKWDEIITDLGGIGIEVFEEYSPADVSIVLDGRYENPAVLDGKKVLITDESLWNNAWSMFMAILPEYYDEITKITGDDVNTIRRVIEHEAEKS